VTFSFERLTSSIERTLPLIACVMLLIGREASLTERTARHFAESRHHGEVAFGSNLLASCLDAPARMKWRPLSSRASVGLPRTIARYTFPVWLYVSITGVLVFALLRVCG
jgi:hypothetical protein